MQASRPGDFTNPLEKIEQLLTCSVCLDRYRNPKLLPCQHTFCMDPCLEGLVDVVRRTVKCPECRAEHPLPVDGVRAYQTNFTLIGFLEIHLQATEESAEELQAYIRRYNMERCKVCDEKGEVDYCAHCDKRICEECKTTHLEMIKRDLGRLMTQARRIALRITEASESLAKGLDTLASNAIVVKEEIQDYVKRYVKELQKREDTLLTEIDTFTQAEGRMMRDLRENIEVEAANINQACSRIDACIKGERSMSDEELVRYKQMFVDGLEYLRLFNFDSEDYATKKIRFVVGADPHILPHAISQFGELHVCTTHFNKYQNADTYIPRFSLGLESDNYAVKRRSCEPTIDTTPWSRQEEEERRFNRFGRRIPPESSDGGSAHRRRFAPTEDESAQRSTRRTDSARTSRVDDPGDTVQVQPSPWSRVHQIHGIPPAEPVPVEPTPTTSRTEEPRDSAVRAIRRMQKQRSDSDDDALNERIAKIRRDYETRKHTDYVAVVEPTTASAQATTATAEKKDPKQYRTRTKTLPEQSLRDMTPPMPRDATSDDESDAMPVPVPVTHFPASGPPRPFLTMSVPRSHQDARRSTTTTSSEVNNSPEANKLDWKRFLIPSPTPVPTATTSSAAPSTSNAQPQQRTTSTAASKQQKTSEPQTTVSLARDYSRDRRSSSKEEDSDWLERRRQFERSRTNPDLSASETSGATTERSKVTKDAAATQSSTERRRRTATTSSAEQEATDQTANQLTREDNRPSRYRRKVERSYSSHGQSSLDNDNENDTKEPTVKSTADEAVRPTPAPRTGPAPVPPKINYREKLRVDTVKFGAKGTNCGQFNWPRGIAIIPTVDEIAVCDSSNHRVQIFDHRGVFLRYFGSYGSSHGEFDCLAGICVNKYRQFVCTDRYNHRVQIFDSNGRFLREFGQHGQTNGRFSSPWGVVVDNQGFIYVCDKDNHRIQIFQADGNFVGKFGGIGNREGQFQNPHFIACNKQNQLIVSDSSNHRIQIFDHNGHYVSSIGSEGFQEGQFKYPRGVAVDEQGFILVCDSGNNRIQVFYPDGKFYCMFGTWGTGDGQLKQVEGVALLSDGRVCVSDRENHRIQIF